MKPSTHAEDNAHRRSLEERKHVALYEERQRARRIEDALRSLLSYLAPACGEYLNGNDEHAELYNECQQAREAIQSRP